LSQKQLGRLALPLGSWYKKDVFSKAQEMGFNYFAGSESQDVCFLADHSLLSFMKKQGITGNNGDIISATGQWYGSHRGIWKYTVGQRRGLGIPDATPWYVIGLDAEKNRVIIGKDDELLQTELLLDRVQWQIKEPEKWQGGVQLRSRHNAAEAQLLPVPQESRTTDKQDANNQWRVLFKKPQRAITPGKFAVFYQDNQLVGSGIIRGTTAILL
jgi:tRNA-specific 2-thiouridylase